MAVTMPRDWSQSIPGPGPVRYAPRGIRQPDPGDTRPPARRLGSGRMHGSRRRRSRRRHRCGRALGRSTGRTRPGCRGTAVRKRTPSSSENAMTSRVRRNCRPASASAAAMPSNTPRMPSYLPASGTVSMCEPTTNTRASGVSRRPPADHVADGVDAGPCKPAAVIQEARKFRCRNGHASAAAGTCESAGCGSSLHPARTSQRRQDVVGSGIDSRSMASSLTYLAAALLAGPSGVP